MRNGGGERGGSEELDKGGRAQDEVMALMRVLALGVTLGLRRGRRTLQYGTGHL